MSHYITAEYKDTEFELAVGISSSSIESIEGTGFDIYIEYGLFGGFFASGPGVTIEVDMKTAEHAYLSALAWAKTLQQEFPERYAECISEILGYKEDFISLLKFDKFEQEEINSKVIENLSTYEFLSQKDIENSFYFFRSIIEFTYNVYNFTQSGRSMEMYFG